MENEIADWIKAGGKVGLDVKFSDFNGTRPGRLDVEYNVYDGVTGKKIYHNIKDFRNAAGESFERVSRKDIESYFTK